MSTQAISTGEKIPLGGLLYPMAPDPGTQRRKTNLPPKAIIADEERAPGIMKESTVWDVYNNEAMKVDNELVKDWTASLNFLLVFVGLSCFVTILLLILVGGYLCCRTHRIYHREQEDVGTRSN